MLVFLKNVSDKYLPWDELLSDMVDFLYRDELEDAYEKYCHETSGCSQKSKGEFISNFRKKIFQREGYIEIVAKYWRQKGYREAIEAYIEERTPYLSFGKECLYIVFS